MRILFVVSNCRIGGAENFTLRLAQGLRKHFPEAQIDCLITHAHGDLYSQYQKTFDELHNAFNLDHYQRVQRLLCRMESGYDLIHSIDNFDLMSMLGEFILPPIVQNVFLDITPPEHAYVRRWIEKALPRYKALVTEYSQNVEPLSISAGTPVYQINNGIDTEFWTPTDKREKKVCWVGRLTERKGGRILAEIIKQSPDISFHVVANEPNKSAGFLHEDFTELSKQCLNLKYEWSLKPEQLREVYRSSMFYLHTSLSEAHPGTLLEAMSCGCIPLAGDVGGIPEILESRLLTVSMNQTDLPTAFSGVLKCWLKMKPSEYQPLSEAMRQRVINAFSLEKTVKQYAEVYQSILKL